MRQRYAIIVKIESNEIKNMRSKRRIKVQPAVNHHLNQVL